MVVLLVLLEVVTSWWRCRVVAPLHLNMPWSAFDFSRCNLVLFPPSQLSLSPLFRFSLLLSSSSTLSSSVFLCVCCRHRPMKITRQKGCHVLPYEQNHTVCLAGPHLFLQPTPPRVWGGGGYVEAGLQHLHRKINNNLQSPF